MKTVDTIIVGAGQAGLGVSYYLKQEARSHIVLEQGRVGETWLSQRWDSFKLNTLNDMNTLPGMPYQGAEADGFWSAAELVDYFRQYISRFQLPVREGVAVSAVTPADKGDGFLVRAQNGAGQVIYHAHSVVIACGSQRIPKIPAVASRLPASVTQLHACDYQSPAALPAGAVIVVGSGQSGCQISEDLLAAGRTVYLCTSKVGRAPRRYRGRDMLDWFREMDFLETRTDSLEDKSVTLAAQPQVSGLGRRGHTVSLQSMAAAGAVILGRLEGVEGETMLIGRQAAAHVQFADAFSQMLKDHVDAFLTESGTPLPPLEPDPADQPDLDAACASPLRRLDLRQADVGAVVWATGYMADFSWIQLPVLDADGAPVHERGISPVPGLYFIGFPWLSSRKSGIIYGIEQDAAHIARDIEHRLA